MNLRVAFKRAVVPGAADGIGVRIVKGFELDGCVAVSNP